MGRRALFPFLVLGGLLAAVAAALWWLVTFRSADPLVEITDGLEARPVPGRLHLLPEYAPWSGGSSGSPVGDRGAESSNGSFRGLSRSSLRPLLAAGEREPTSAALQRAATAHLLVGNATRAVECLERAVRIEPERAELWSDLSAAYLSRSLDGHPFDAVRALTAGDRASALQGAAPGAGFNRALALEVLHLDRQAALAWDEVAAAEPDGTGWRTETESAIERLDQPPATERWPGVRNGFLAAAAAGDLDGVDELVATSLAGARDDVALELLGDWARAADAGRENDAATALNAVRAIGDRLAEGERDRLLADTVAGIDAADPGAPARGHLVAGLLAFDEGRSLVRSQAYGEAEARLWTAEDALAAAASPLAGLATHHRAVCVFYGNRYDPAEAMLRDLRARVNAGRHPALAALTVRMIGLIGLNRADPGEPLGLWLEAYEGYQRAGDPEGTASIDALFASAYDLLGMRDQAWTHRTAALDRLDVTTSPRRTVSLLGRSGDAAADDGEPAAALAFHDEAVAVAEALGNPLERAVALHSRGRIRARVDDLDGARADFAEAWIAWSELRDSDLKASLQAEILRSEGELPPSGDPDAVIAAQTKAIEFFTIQPKKIFLLDGHAARARAHRARGDLVAAEADLRAALAELERVRARVDGDEERIAFFELAKRQRVVDDLVELLADDRPDEALAVVERGRARALLDRFESDGRRGGGAPESAETALGRSPAELPPGTALAVFHALPGRLLIWIVDAGGIRAPLVGEIGAAELAERVAELRGALTGGAPEAAVRELAGALYDLLLRDALAAVGGIEHLVVIPDKALHLLPFAVLWDHAAGRYLVEAMAVSLAPSVRVYLRSLERSRAHGRAPAGSVLAVGDPEIDRTLFPRLRPLTAARGEAVAIAALYPRSASLTGARADRDAVLAQAGGYEVLHLGVHAVANPESEQGAALLLASSGRGSGGAVYASEISRLDLGGVRLAVLAACDTGAGSVRAGEGVLSLARAFLAAGVPAVVQSLWAVEDEATAELLTAFHRRLREGADPATALREAQVTFLRQSAPGRRQLMVWGAFVGVGG